jgi:hypothetical protein
MPAVQQPMIEDADDEDEVESQDPKCILCNRQFSSLKLLKKHNYYCMKRSNVKNLGKKKKPALAVRSRVIKSRFKNRPELLLMKNTRDRNLSKKSITAFKCSFCPFTFSTKNSMDRHMLNAHEVGSNAHSIFCQGEKRSAEKANLKERNPSKVLKTEPYRCGVCGLALKSNLQLKNHLAHKHKHKILKDGILFPCNICKTYFSDEKRLARHLLNIHECDKNYKSVRPQGVKRTKLSVKCSECEEKFDMLFELEKHVKENHKNVQRYSSWM